ncbi:MULTISPECIES: hypothetical protein [unclassified Flavobacterium]|uniref:hypothetical protein n=1 Tax=unclassified Flavobacterium TaxID=196869 RepID=UPI001F12B41A|nr:MULTISPECIES: hypothetical protein [unclassified Flavobacterium]UMY64916.1 hypothetical protein MKO97_10365 [Flavobacterium sp. HJ-32-4]
MRLLFLLLCTTRLLSQDVAGQWKVVSYEDETAFFDIENRQVQFTDPAGGDPIAFQNRVLRWVPLSYSFDREGRVFIDFPDDLEDGSGIYRVERGDILFSIGPYSDKETASFAIENNVIVLNHKTRNGFIKFRLKRMSQ